METSKQNLIIKPNGRGIGVFSKISIPAGLKIFEFSGDVLTTEQLSTRHPSDVIDFLQIGIDLWRSKSGTFDDYIAHSCNPNCYVKIVGNRAILTTIYNIVPNMELTYDWGTTSTETPSEWQMECKCGYIHCRKVISGISTVPKNIVEEYSKQNLLPAYILSYVKG
jgi:SET domain-containing protein